MSTLHERLLAEIERRERTALGHSDEPEQWTYHAGDAVIRDGDGWEVTSDLAERHARHVELHDPADALRRYARDRKVLERHERDHIYDEYVWSCVRCTDGDLVAVEWPCDDIRDLAESLGVPIEEAEHV